MKSLHFLGVTFALLLAPAVPNGKAQADIEESSFRHVHREPMVVMGREVVIATNEVVENLVVINGSVQLKGTVEQELVLVGGTATVEGKIRGNLVAIGDAIVDSSAEIWGDAIVIGGHLQADPNAMIKGSRMEFYLGHLSGLITIATDWVLNGLMWLRPFPHQSAWAWAMGGALLLLYFVLTLVFRQPVERCSNTLRASPAPSLLIGLLVFVVLGPLLVILVSSVIGLVVVPFVLCGFVAALVFGKTVFYHAVGRQVGEQLGLHVVERPLTAVCLGALIFFVLYLVPILGLVVWGIVLPIGLGALCLTAGRNLALSRPKTPAGSIDSGSRVATAVTTAPMMATPPVPMPTHFDSTLTAGFWIRTGAAALDLLIVTFLSMALDITRSWIWLCVIYHVVMWAWQGTTLGGMVLGLRLVRLDGRPLDFGLAMVRCLAAILSAIPLFLGFLWVGWDPERLSWHDRIAGTMILQTHRGLASVPKTSASLAAPPAAAPPTADSIETRDPLPPASS